jgi:hypothetical protein
LLLGSLLIPLGLDSCLFIVDDGFVCGWETGDFFDNVWISED